MRWVHTQLMPRGLSLLVVYKAYGERRALAVEPLVWDFKFMKSLVWFKLREFCPIDMRVPWSYKKRYGWASQPSTVNRMGWDVDRYAMLIVGAEMDVSPLTMPSKGLHVDGQLVPYFNQCIYIHVHVHVHMSISLHHSKNKWGYQITINLPEIINQTLLLWNIQCT